MGAAGAPAAMVPVGNALELDAPAVCSGAGAPGAIADPEEGASVDVGAGRDEDEGDPLNDAINHHTPAPTTAAHSTMASTTACQVDSPGPVSGDPSGRVGVVRSI